MDGFVRQPVLNIHLKLMFCCQYFNNIFHVGSPYIQKKHLYEHFNNNGLSERNGFVYREYLIIVCFVVALHHSQLSVFVLRVEFAVGYCGGQERKTLFTDF